MAHISKEAIHISKSILQTRLYLKGLKSQKLVKSARHQNKYSVNVTI